MQIYISYTFVKRIEIVENVEGRFEEAVIAYLFIVNLLPIFIVIIMWYEARKVASILNEWSNFEVSMSVCVCAGAAARALLLSFHRA
jgi:gustatory receptor